MTAKSIGCAAGCARMFLDAESHDRHLESVHHTTYDLATGSTLTQDECDALGLDGRDGTGEYTLSDLNATQRDALYAFRNRP